MTQDKLQRLHKLEEAIEKLKEARVRASERLSLLRQQRDGYMEELRGLGIDPKHAKSQLTDLADEIERELTEIEDQIPPNLEELLTSEEHIGD